MPYASRPRYWGLHILQPPLTQTLGPWLRSSNARYPQRLSRDVDLLQDLISQLPAFAQFNQNWHFSNTNWLPFYWNGFEQTTRYTYRIPCLADPDAIWAGFRENIRGDIRKATNRFGLNIRYDLGIDEFLPLLLKTYHRQGRRFPHAVELLRRLDEACIKNKCRQVLLAEDEMGRKHAGVYIVWDERSAYYLMGGGDPQLRSSGATSLCIWEAIKFAADKTKSFDFEGSMVQSIERFFRAFGAIQTPYFAVTKTPSRLYRIGKSIFG